MKPIIYLFIILNFFLYFTFNSCQTCNSGEYYDQITQECQLCSSLTHGCILCDQSSGECLVCSGLYLSFSSENSSYCICPPGQLITLDPISNKYQCANSSIGNAYYNSSQLQAMGENLTLQDLQIIEAAILGVNGKENDVLTKLNLLLSVVENGANFILSQNVSYLNQLAKVLTAFGYVPYSNGNILNSVVSLSSFLFNLNQSNYITINYCMEIFGLVFDKLTNLDYKTLPTSFFANIQGQFDNLISNFLSLKYINLGPSQQVLTNHYTNIWVASIWVDLNTTFFLMSDLALDYSLQLSSSNLTGLTSQSLYIAQVVTEKSPIAFFPGNAQKLTLLSGVVNLQFYELQNGALVNVNSQLLSNPSGMELGFPAYTNNTPYFVNWDRSLQIWEEDFQCYSQNNHSLCKPNLNLAASSFSFSISEQFKYTDICNAGEYQLNATYCQLCNNLTPDCVSCNVLNGECYLCRGLYPSFSDNGTIKCSCPAGMQKVLNISNSNQYECMASTAANQLYTTYLPTIKKYTSDLTMEQLQILEALAMAINGNDSLKNFNNIINILQNAQSVIVYTTDSDLLLQYLKVLLALSYNPSTSYKVLYQVGLISNYIRMSSLIIIDDLYYFMEIYGLINDQISQSKFSWDNATQNQKKFFISQTQTYIDNIKRAVAMQINFTTNSMRSYHFTNLYMSISQVNVSQKYGSGLLQNLYAVEVDSSVLQKIPNNEIYAIHLVQENNPFLLLNQTNATFFTNIQDISFYSSSNFQQANGYFTNLSQETVQLLYPFDVIQTYKMQLDQWSFTHSTWQVSGYCSKTATNVASCYPPSLANSNLYGVAKNTTMAVDQVFEFNNKEFLKKY